MVNFANVSFLDFQLKLRRYDMIMTREFYFIQTPFRYFYQSISTFDNDQNFLQTFAGDVEKGRK